MAHQWDIFADEYKDNARLLGLGALCIHAGVQGVLYDLLAKAKDACRSRNNCKIGQVQWKDLNQSELPVAKDWLNHFFRGPMMFFVRFDADMIGGRATIEGLVRGLIERLEDSPFVPGGLVRGATTLHLDYETSYSGNVLERMRSEFGLLRAFKWDSHGSELLQLTDLLLGISVAETSGRFPTTGSLPSSGRDSIKRQLVVHARQEAVRIERKGKRNVVLAAMHGQERPLFVSS